MGNDTTQTVEDLLTNDCFVEWVLSDGTQHNDVWEAWRLGHPDNAARIHEARVCIRALSAPAPAADTDTAWAQLATQLVPPHATRPPVPLHRRRWLQVAAAVLLLLSGTWWLWPAANTYPTTYNEIRNLTLPDGTRVTLSANSRLSWDAPWAATGVRSVALVGEAYFDVSPASAHGGQPFRVDAGDTHIQVLGTQFSVRQRAAGTQVVLVEGKVAVTHRQQEPVVLLPNQAYTLRPGSTTATVAPVAATKAVAWRQQVWHFDDTPLTDIGQQLSDFYGKRVVWQPTTLATRRLSGAAPATSLDVLTHSIATSLGISVRQTDTDIVFYESPPQ